MKVNMSRVTQLAVPERSRTYHYSSGDITDITLENVTHFGKSDSANHYLNTADGKKHIIAPGWVHIELDVDEWSV